MFSTRLPNSSFLRNRRCSIIYIAEDPPYNHYVRHFYISRTRFRTDTGSILWHILDFCCDISIYPRGRHLRSYGVRDSPAFPSSIYSVISRLWLHGWRLYIVRVRIGSFGDVGRLSRFTIRRITRKPIKLRRRTRDPYQTTASGKCEFKPKRYN